MTINIHSIDVGYDEVLIKNLSLELKKNYIYCISASNGVGKTCLARTLTKFIPDISKNSSLNLYSQYDLDLVSAESNGLIEEYTGAENLKFYAGPNQLLVLNYFSDLSIVSKILKVNAGHFSSGMRQVLKLLISLSSSKDILIWDEPFKSIAPDIKKVICSRLLMNRDLLLANKSLLVLDHVNDHWGNTGVIQMKIKERVLVNDL